MYVRVKVELWQKGDEHQSHEATLLLPESFVSSIAASTYAGAGKHVYSKVISFSGSEDYSTGLVRALAMIITGAYRRYEKAQEAAA